MSDCVKPRELEPHEWVKRVLEQLRVLESEAKSHEGQHDTKTCPNCRLGDAIIDNEEVLGLVSHGIMMATRRVTIAAIENGELEVLR